MDTSVSNLRFIIVGASIAGLSVALTLQRLGLDYVIYEREDENREGGAGVDIEFGAKCRLDYLGANTSTFYPIESRKYLDLEENVIYNNTIPRFSTNWLNLNKSLVSPINKDKLFYNHKVESFEHVTSTDGNKKIRVIVRRPDISTFTDEGDYLIAADGIHSTIRKSLNLEQKVRFSGYIAIRGTIHLENCKEFNSRKFLSKYSGMPQTIYFKVSPNKGSMCFYLISGNILNWMWYYNSEPETTNAITYIPSDEFLSKIKDEALTLWDEEIIEMMNSSNIFVTSIYDLDPLNRFVYDKVILLGDAAHAIRPHGGQACSMALKDSFYLERALKKSSDIGINDAFEEFCKLRTDETGFNILQARKMGSYLQNYETGKDLDIEFRDWPTY